MTDEKYLIRWPVLLRVKGDVELITVGSAEQLGNPQWRADTGLFPDIAMEPQSWLECMEVIDANGQVFSIQPAERSSIEYIASGHRYGLGEVIQYVQQHAALQGHCCVAKMGAKSIDEAIHMVEQLDQ